MQDPEEVKKLLIENFQNLNERLKIINNILKLKLEQIEENDDNIPEAVDIDFEKVSEQKSEDK